MPTSIRPIADIARELGLADEEWTPYGRTKAKVLLPALQARRDRPDGKLVVVSSITPTPAGDGKTTMTIGLGQALWRIGARPVIALREPSIGPTLGMKGGGTGGGLAQVLPMEEIKLKVTGAMAALLRDAVHPNLVQTMEGTPALVHGGPFANIAHGCNSVVATRLALKLGDICLTEAGFATDLGAEKFFDIKCRLAGLVPDGAMIVATARALKYHGGIPVPELGKENLEALVRGLDNLEAHVTSVRQFKVPVLVGLNRYPTDTDREHQAVLDFCDRLGVSAYVADVFGRGGEGGEDLARGLLKLLGSERSAFTPLYPLDASIKAKLEI